MIKRLIWTIWTPMSSVLKKADKLNLSLSLLEMLPNLPQYLINAFVLSVYTFLLLILMLLHRQAIFESKGDTLFSAAECRIRTQGLRELNLQPTECPLTNRLSYQGSSWNLELNSLSLWSTSIQPTQPHCQLAFAPGSGDIHVCNHSFRCSVTGKRFSNHIYGTHSWSSLKL